MEYQRIKYERYNLFLNDNMAGDGSLDYEYDEQGALSKVIIQLIPYPAQFSELENKKIDAEWQNKLEVVRLNTTSDQALMAILETMVNKTILDEKNAWFQLRRRVIEVGFEKSGESFAYYVINELAPFPPEEQHITSTVVQAKDQSKAFYFSSEDNLETILASIKVQS